MSSLDKQIVDILESRLLSIRSSSQGDLFEERGREELIQKTQAFIQRKQPIELLLPAFPCKSPNLNKVSGKLPDAGELYALEYLDNICQEISLLYEPGCQLRIWSDGRVFGDLIGVPPEDISRYESLLKHYSKRMRHIDWDSMNNYIDARNGESLVEKYGSDDFSFEEWLSKSEDNRQQFSQLRKFMESDSKHLPENQPLSRRLLKEKMSAVAEEMIRRNDALTGLLRQHYPDHIRLSIHQHVNDGSKLTVQLLKDSNESSDEARTLRTPWHNVLVMHADGSLNLVPHRKLNLEKEHLPITFKNQIWCYVQAPSSDTSDSFVSAVKLSILGPSPRSGLLMNLQKKIDASQLNADWIKMLTRKFGMIVLRQTEKSFDRASYSRFCEKFGAAVIWRSGTLWFVKPVSESTSDDKSKELSPLHFRLSDPPKSDSQDNDDPEPLVLFYVQALHEDHGGNTTFMCGQVLLESSEENGTLQFKTRDNTCESPQSPIGERSFVYPLIMTRPQENEAILRFCQQSNPAYQLIQGHGATQDAQTHN